MGWPGSLAPGGTGGQQGCIQATEVGVIAGPVGCPGWGSSCGRCPWWELLQWGPRSGSAQPLALWFPDGLPGTDGP